MERVKPARYDYEYERCGVCNVFLAVEPLAGQRLIQVSQRKTKATGSPHRDDLRLLVNAHQREAAGFHGVRCLEAGLLVPLFHRDTDY